MKTWYSQLGHLNLSFKLYKSVLESNFQFSDENPIDVRKWDCSFYHCGIMTSGLEDQLLNAQCNVLHEINLI